MLYAACNSKSLAGGHESCHCLNCGLVKRIEESMFKLELRFQNFTIREYSLRNGDVRFIGRGAENHIMVDDPHVSRRHARIARWGDELFVGDEGSKQGTAVNGMQVICAKLKHGDIVNIGASQNPQASFVAIEEETITDFLKATT